jgi:hypothetical protein
VADYWIKVYHEIIDDPKMATMPDRLWRRTMEIFLLAGKLSKDKSGLLPETNQLAWLLRMNSDDLLMDLRQLESAGILKREGDGWLVVNFEKRQAASTSTERVQQFRDRKRKNQYYGNEEETQEKRIVSQNTEYREQNTETESETEREPARAQADQIEFISGTLKPLQKLAEKKDPFDVLLDEIEHVIGLPQGHQAVEVIQEMIKLGVETCDIQEAADWYRSNGKTIHSAKSLLGPVKTAVMKRKQMARSPTLEKSKKNGGKSASEMFLDQEMEKYNASIRL